MQFYAVHACYNTIALFCSDNQTSFDLNLVKNPSFLLLQFFLVLPAVLNFQFFFSKKSQATTGSQILLFSCFFFPSGDPHHPQILALALVGCAAAAPEAEPKAAADPYYYGGYGGYGLRGYGLGYRTYGYGLGGHFYGKRSAEAEPKAEAEADPYYYGGYYGGLGYRGLGLGYRTYGYGLGGHFYGQMTTSVQDWP